MAVVMDVELPPGTFLFGEVFQQLPNVRLEVERVVPIRNEVLPFVWVWGDNRREFESVATEYVPITHLEEIFEDEDALLYRMFWTADAAAFFDAIHVTGLVVTHASGTVDGWTLSLQFDDRNSVRQFRTRCAENDIEFEVTRVTDVADWQANRYDLTDSQRETLYRAYEAGYFREPRETSVEELADEFGISARAMSGRLRRGTERLIRSTLSKDKPG